MENLSTNNKASLINLEQTYAQQIQSDKNASDMYMSTMDQIGELMSNADLTVTQQSAGMNELVGMLDAYLDFNSSLSGVNSVTGVTSGTAQEQVNINWGSEIEASNVMMDVNDPKFNSILEAYTRNPQQFQGYGFSGTGVLTNIQGAYTSADGLKHQQGMIFAQDPNTGIWLEIKE